MKPRFRAEWVVVREETGNSLIDGTRGIPVDIGRQLYKSLVRPHLEYAFPTGVGKYKGQRYCGVR